MKHREQPLAETFVKLADSLVGDYDVSELLHGLVMDVTGLLDVDAAGLLLDDQRGSLQLLASSSEATRLLELFQLQSDEGPCLECYSTGEPVSVPDLSAVAEQWPVFTPAALGRGFAAVHALPMRLRQQTIGALNLFSVEVGPLDAGDLVVAQAMADVATIGIMQERAVHELEVIAEQTQALLNDGVVVEQGTGILAAGGLDMDQAYETLRSYAHVIHIRLADVARNLVEGHLDPGDVIAGS